MISLHKIVQNSYVDGPGKRVTVFFQGCPIACPGCQNIHLWPVQGGNLMDEDNLALYVAALAEGHDGVTISGGEPFFQAAALARLVRALKKYGVKHIMVYSGHTFEELINPVSPAYLWVTEILSRIDVLVDGPFKRELDHGRLIYRGSSNQRAIDVQATLQTEALVILDWDSEEIEILPNGDMYMPIDTARDFAEIGLTENTRRCGQTK